MKWQRPIALAAVSATALAASWNALAATIVSPAPDSVVAGPNPTFVVHLRRGDAFPRIQVGASPNTDVSGLSNRIGLCVPTPSGAGQASCELHVGLTGLKDGTYYWMLLYERKDNCFTAGRRVCFFAPHVTRVVRFRVSSQAS